MTLRERLMRKVQPVPFSGCWLWTGATFNHGYGQIRISTHTSSQLHLAHRVMFCEMVGTLPAELDLRHRCQVRLCVNPDHLEPIAPADRIRLVPKIIANWQNYRERTECPRGHPYDKANTYTRNNHRQCRACHAERQRQRRARR